tara:strand:- start:185 stop:1027 length:843 start_codon:yes stop_codon:yes gene_type:complete
MYPGNHTESDMLYVPRYLKTRPGAPQTHLAYITDDEAEMLQQYKPGTPHEGAAGIPNYDTWSIDPSGNVTGGSTADGGGAWSGDVGGNQPDPNQGNQNNVNADIYKQMADTMKQAGQIGGGLSGGTYTKGPVVYPKSWYTHEGWAEVQKRGWSDKLKPAHQFGGKWSVTHDEADKYGQFQTLPEGVIYSSNIGDPETGYGGYKKTSLFDYNTGTGGGFSWRPRYGGYGGNRYINQIPLLQAQLSAPYSEARYGTDPMQRWMVESHSPMYAARGGIMSLRR